MKLKKLHLFCNNFGEKTVWKSISETIKNKQSYFLWQQCGTVWKFAKITTDGSVLFLNERQIKKTTATNPDEAAFKKIVRFPSEPQLVAKLVKAHIRPALKSFNPKFYDCEYVMIDFETATKFRDSACQIAIAKVKNNKVIERYNSLIRPEPLAVNSINFQIHHISVEQLQGQPSFNQIWSEIKHFFNKNCVVLAHNAAFDMSVLRQSLEHYQIPLPEFDYGCTVQIIKKIYEYDNYKLGYLAEQCQYNFNHHDANEDVNATIEIINQHFENGKTIMSMLEAIKYRFKHFG